MIESAEKIWNYLFNYILSKLLQKHLNNSTKER